MNYAKSVSCVYMCCLGDGLLITRSLISAEHCTSLKAVDATYGSLHLIKC